MIGWLSPLIPLSECAGDWHRYLEKLYAVFQHDFIQNSPLWEGMPVRHRRQPLYQDKSATFWHLISEGDFETERIPDLRRCERIRWPRIVIERAKDPAILVWKNQRGNGTNVCLWAREADYLVVLGLRRDYVLLLTAYTVDQEHRRRKLLKEYEACTKG